MHPGIYGYHRNGELWPLTNIALLLRYDGTTYHGWQSQKNGDTIQHTVSNAIHRLTCARPLPELHGVGRTDAGVHALNYVANFLSETRIPVDRLPYALKQYLPDDIVDAKYYTYGQNKLEQAAKQYWDAIKNK